MDHKFAADSMALERYLLGELNSDERKDFEHHAFDCADCATALEQGIAFLDNGRELVVAEERFRPRKTVMHYIPTAVAAALAVVVGVQNLVTIPALRQAATMPAIRVLDAHELNQTRGAEQQIKANEPSLLYVNVPSEQPYPSYRAALRDSAKRELGFWPITAQQASQIVPLQLGPLPAGSYVVAIEGVREDGNRSLIGEYPINVVQGP
jgi:hypothetical protein